MEGVFERRLFFVWVRVMIALYYAMPKEIDSLLKREGESLMGEEAGVKFYRLRENVMACVGGIGKVNAAMATQLLISRCHPDLILNVGVAGCFKNVAIGTMILAERFVQHDVDTTGCGDPIGLVSTVNVVSFSTDGIDVAKKALDRVGVAFLCGTGATGDWFAKGGDRACWIRETFDPLFVDMEGGAVAQVCYRNRVRFMAIKSVSDCLFGDDRYDFNFSQAMLHLNEIAMRFIDYLEI